MLAWHVLRDRTLLLPRETPEAVEDLYRLGCRFSSTPERAAHWARRVGKGFGLRALREPDARFGGGERLDFGFAQLEAVHTPGHLEDHYCFYEHDSGLLLTTDIDFSAFGPWYGNPESDILRFRQSVKQVMRREYRMVCSSHKRPVSGDASADFADFLEGFERQRRQVLELCHPPRSLTEMTSLSPFYRNRAPDRIVQEMFEETMILKNLELLIQDGLVAKVDGRYRRR
jgi:glyoxylase-like metal-dependent hydrolase (beta-lactamase superfamily II)